MANGARRLVSDMDPSDTLCELKNDFDDLVRAGRHDTMPVGRSGLRAIEAGLDAGAGSTREAGVQDQRRWNGLAEAIEVAELDDPMGPIGPLWIATRMALGREFRAPKMRQARGAGRTKPRGETRTPARRASRGEGDEHDNTSHAWRMHVATPGDNIDTGVRSGAAAPTNEARRQRTGERAREGLSEIEVTFSGGTGLKKFPQPLGALVQRAGGQVEI